MNQNQTDENEMINWINTVVRSSTLIFLLLFIFPALAQQAPTPRQATFQVGDNSRSIQVYIPTELDKEIPSPLVFNLHGTGGMPEGQERISRMSVIAEREKFILVGGVANYLRADGSRTWNADLDPNGVSDVDYIVSAIEIVATMASVDRKRIYVTGFSGGGRMTSRLACELADTLAAVAPVAGIQFGEHCDPARAVPLITLHSKDDPTNTYYHANTVRNPSWVAGVESAVVSWAEANKCGTNPNAENISPEVTKVSYGGCADQSNVVFYQLESGGHSWPSTSSSNNVNASELIWEFFEMHQRP